ncbi:transposase [Streptomyces shenzhenensis]|uniref:transposase n=1 Tax=Streptomyces shenzhenensis TaxID=943815 RepID=UPI00381C0E18
MSEHPEAALEEVPGLLERLAEVPDPRDPRGVRHRLAVVPALTACAVPAGAVGDCVADVPVHVGEQVGVRPDPLLSKRVPPPRRRFAGCRPSSTATRWTARPDAGSRIAARRLTAFEKKTGWRYCITATNIRHMWGIVGSGHAQFLDVLHRSHAGVEGQVRTNKAMGLNNLPSQSWEVNRGWMLAANLAADLDASVRLLALHDIDGLADAEPDTMRFRLYHLPARLADHARRRWLRIQTTWPWATALTTCWQRLTALLAIT